MATYVITNVRVLDGIAHEPFPGAVRVEGDRIAEVIPGATAPPPRGVTVIDGAGATLMPGRIVLQDRSGLRVAMKDGTLHKGP